MYYDIYGIGNGFGSGVLDSHLARCLGTYIGSDWENEFSYVLPIGGYTMGKVVFTEYPIREFGIGYRCIGGGNWHCNRDIPNDNTINLAPMRQETLRKDK